MRRILTVVLLMLPAWLYAGGFQLGTQGQQVMGMGGSVTGFALDASSAFYNPGALISLKSSSLDAGVSLLMPEIVFSGPYGGNENSGSSLALPAYIYGMYKFRERWVFGLSVNSPFGFHTRWEDDWSGRYIVQNSRLSTLCVQPTAAFRVNDWLSIGGGAVLTRGTYEQQRALNIRQGGSPEAGVQLKGSGSALGLNAGVFAEWGKTSLGLSYRSALEVPIEDGDVVFNSLPAFYTSTGAFPSGSVFTTAIRLPSVISFGLGRSVDENLKLNLDVNLYSWSQSDPIQYSVENVPYLSSEMPAIEGSSLAVRLGGQYRYSAKLALLAGLAFEQTPVQGGDVSPMFPDADRFVFSGGATYKVKERIVFSAALRFENMRERREVEEFTDRLVGTYKSYTYVAGIGINYSF